MQHPARLQQRWQRQQQSYLPSSLFGLGYQADWISRTPGSRMETKVNVSSTLARSISNSFAKSTSLLRKLECLLYIWNIPASVLPGCQTRGDVGRGRDDEVVATAGRGNNTVLSAAHVITGLAGPQTTHPPAGIRWQPGSSSVGCIALQTSGLGD